MNHPSMDFPRPLVCDREEEVVPASDEVEIARLRAVLGSRDRHIAEAELLLDELADEWHVGEPHHRILLAAVHAVLAVAKAINPPACHE